MAILGHFCHKNIKRVLREIFMEVDNMTDLQQAELHYRVRVVCIENREQSAAYLESDAENFENFHACSGC